MSLAALYAKINNTDPSLSRALLTGSTERLESMLMEMDPPWSDLPFPGDQLFDHVLRGELAMAFEHGDDLDALRFDSIR